MGFRGSKSKNWFVLIGDQKYGPYDYRMLIQMLQTNQLMDFNYVWADHLDSWTPIYQIEDFSRDRFQNLLQKESELKSAFIVRKGARVDVKIFVTGHDSMRFFNGEIVSLSESGALCLFHKNDLRIGNKIKLHVANQDSVSQEFTIECDIIRKNHSKTRINQNSGLFYAVKFHDLSELALQYIRQWVEAA